jgi:hypothetical protein
MATALRSRAGFASHEELLALVEETGRAGGGSISYLPKSVVGGLDAADEAAARRARACAAGCRS